MSMMDQPSLTDMTAKLMKDIDNIDIERICQNIEQCLSAPFTADNVCSKGKAGCPEGFLCNINHVRFHTSVKRIRTYTKEQYDRSGSDVDENDEGVSVVDNLAEIARELNEYKMKEMVIHPSSAQYTALCPL